MSVELPNPEFRGKRCGIYSPWEFIIRNTQIGFKKFMFKRDSTTNFFLGISNISGTVVFHYEKGHLFSERLMIRYPELGYIQFVTQKS